MRLGIKAMTYKTILFLLVILILALWLSFPSVGMARDFEKTRAVLQHEAYYHFFLEDYLTSATRLKLIEQEGMTRQDEKTLNEARLLLGSLYLAWGMHRPATTVFSDLVERFPPGKDRNQVLLLIERLQYSRSLYQAAVETYRLLKADKEFSSIDQASYLAGMSHYILGSFEDGLRALKTIPPESDYFPFAQLASAKSYTYLKNFQEAIRLLKELGELDHRGDPTLKALAEKSRLVLGLLLTEMGQYEEAHAVLTSMPIESPFYPDALFGAGWSRFYQERYPEALLAFQDLIRTAPEHSYSLEALTTVGHCYNRMGVYQAALKVYEDALETYSREGQAMASLRQLIHDRSRLATLLQSFKEVQRSPLASLLEDDGLRFWIKLYGELVSMEGYLDQKLSDMDVFKVMVDHREEVFQDHLPTVRWFLKEDPVRPLQEKGQQLQARLEQAIHDEGVRVLATVEEVMVLNELSRARSKSEALKAAVGTLEGSSSEERKELKEKWRTTNRWLELLRGELLWKIITEVPGRSDDLGREVKRINRDLDALAERQTQLVNSIPAAQIEIRQFRDQIQQVREDLLEKREKLTELRERLLPPLQALLLKTLDLRMGRIEALAATARLSQIQILDLKSGS
jgi:tetratricopeptide (TPR) repeat protein